MRVADLARNLGIDIVDLMTALDQMGITVVSDATALQPAQVAAVLDHPIVVAARARKRDGGSRIADRGPEAVSPIITPPPARAPAEPPTAEVSGVVTTATARPPAPASPPLPPQAPIDPIEQEWQQAARSRPIVLWGPPGSGKSTFLAAMMFRQNEEDPLDPFDWRIMSVGSRAGDYVRSVLQAYRAGGQPNATLVTEAPFRFKVRKYRKQHRAWGLVQRPEQIRLEADLVLVDPPGELFTVSKMRGRTGQRLLELMEHAGGLLLLIDPTYTERGRYWTMLVENLSEILDYLKRKQPGALDDENRLRLPTAICITKMDQHQADAHRPAEFLREQIGEAAVTVIENSFSNYSVYACSALGNNYQPPANPQPWGIVDPIRWILEESGQRSRSQVLARFGW